MKKKIKVFSFAKLIENEVEEKKPKAKEKTKKVESKKKGKADKKDNIKDSKPNLLPLLPEGSFNNQQANQYSFLNPTYPEGSFGAIPKYSPIIQQDSVFESLKRINGDLDLLTSHLKAMFPVIETYKSYAKFLPPASADFRMQTDITAEEQVEKTQKKRVTIPKQIEKVPKEAIFPLRESAREIVPAIEKNKTLTVGSPKNFPKQSVTYTYRPLNYSPFYNTGVKGDSFRTVRDFYQGNPNLDKGHAQIPAYRTYDKTKAKDEPFRTVRDARVSSNKYEGNRTSKYSPKNNPFYLPAKGYYH